MADWKASYKTSFVISLTAKQTLQTSFAFWFGWVEFGSVQFGSSLGRSSLGSVTVWVGRVWVGPVWVEFGSVHFGSSRLGYCKQSSFVMFALPVVS